MFSTCVSGSVRLFQIAHIFLEGMPGADERLIMHQVGTVHSDIDMGHGIPTALKCVQTVGKFSSFGMREGK